MVWDVLHAATPILRIPGRLRAQPLCPDQFAEQRDDPQRPWMRLIRERLGGHTTTQKQVRGVQQGPLLLNTTQSPASSAD